MPIYVSAEGISGPFEKSMGSKNYRIRFVYSHVSPLLQSVREQHLSITIPHFTIQDSWCPKTCPGKWMKGATPIFPLLPFAALISNCCCCEYPRHTHLPMQLHLVKFSSVQATNISRNLYVRMQRRIFLLGCLHVHHFLLQPLYPCC